MDLATHQRKLLGLLRSDYELGFDDDEYVQRVARSKELQEARRNVFLWRLWVLERTCILTFTLLKRRNLLGETLNAFIKRNNISIFRETHAPAFLENLTTHHDRLVRSVAQFELALLKVRQGDPGCYAVRWNVEPHSVLNSLARDIPLNDELPDGAYQIRVWRELPHQFEISAVIQSDPGVDTTKPGTTADSCPDPI